MNAPASRPPLVSAIIPTYNYGHLIARAIDSVLAQTYPSVECIVVDDGSTDDTVRVLERYGDRIRVVQQANRGVSAARNAGVRASRGVYLGLLDADDAWMPEKLARQVPILEADPELGAVGCAVELKNRDATPVALPARTVPRGYPERVRSVALREAWVEGSNSGALIPARVFAEVGGFDEELVAAEDWDLWLRIVARHRVFNLPEHLVSIWFHGTGTFRDPEKMERWQWRVYETAVARWPDALDVVTRRRMRALILADAGGEYVLAGERRKALGRYLAASLAWPLAWSRWRRVAVLAARELLRA